MGAELQERVSKALHAHVSQSYGLTGERDFTRRRVYELHDDIYTHYGLEKPRLRHITVPGRHHELVLAASYCLLWKRDVSIRYGIVLESEYILLIYWISSRQHSRMSP